MHQVEFNYFDTLISCAAFSCHRVRMCVTIMYAFPLLPSYTGYGAIAIWKWNGVAVDDQCSICRQPFDGCCTECKFPGEDCPLGLIVLYSPHIGRSQLIIYLFFLITVWGQCTHCFHMHCIMKWLNSQQINQNCPMVGFFF